MHTCIHAYIRTAERGASFKDMRRSRDSSTEDKARAPSDEEHLSQDNSAVNSLSYQDRKQGRLSDEENVSREVSIHASAHQNDRNKGRSSDEEPLRQENSVDAYTHRDRRRDGDVVAHKRNKSNDGSYDDKYSERGRAERSHVDSGVDETDRRRLDRRGDGALKSDHLMQEMVGLRQDLTTALSLLDVSERFVENLQSMLRQRGVRIHAYTHDKGLSKSARAWSAMCEELTDALKVEWAVSDHLDQQSDRDDVFDYGPRYHGGGKMHLERQPSSRRSISVPPLVDHIRECVCVCVCVCVNIHVRVYTGRFLCLPWSIMYVSV
jgi:hypothetical protein